MFGGTPKAQRQAKTPGPSALGLGSLGSSSLRIGSLGSLLGIGLLVVALAGCKRSDTRGDTGSTEAATDSDQLGAEAENEKQTKNGQPVKPDALADEQSTANATDSSESNPATEPEATEPQSDAECVAPLAEPPPPEAQPAEECPTDPTGNLDLNLASVTFVDAPGQPRISVEHAEDMESRQRGLMYRTHMEDDTGMLFTFPDERIRSFWMKNTCIPLDMLFIDQQGNIVGILEQVPTLNLKSRSVPCPAQRVLEVNAGWTRRHGVKPGQRLLIET